MIVLAAAGYTEKALAARGEPASTWTAGLVMGPELPDSSSAARGRCRAATARAPPPSCTRRCSSGGGAWAGAPAGGGGGGGGPV